VGEIGLESSSGGTEYFNDENEDESQSNESLTSAQVFDEPGVFSILLWFHAQVFYGQVTNRFCNFSASPLAANGFK